MSSSPYPYGSVAPSSTTVEPTTNGNTEFVVRNKQGHSCCAGCCDVRRAVIIVDAIAISLLLLDIWGAEWLRGTIEQKEAAGADASVDDTVVIEDDQAAEKVEDALGVFVLIVLFEIALLGVAIGGAISFSTRMVAVGMGVHGISMVMSLAQLNLVAAVVAGSFFYPHYFLFQEIKAGIMTPENYYNEEQSCCCV